MKRIAFLVFIICIAMGIGSCQILPADTPSKESAAKRVIAGTVSAAQYLDALGADVVAVPTTEKNLPEAYEGKPQIGQPMTPNLELIMAQEPDLFIADVTMKATLEEMFHGKEIELILLDNNSFDSITENIHLLAEKLGLEEKGRQVTAEVRQKKEQAMAMAEGKSQPKVAILFGTTAMFMLATEHSCVGSMAALLGAENITDHLGLQDAYVTFDREQLAARNPDVILRLSHADPEETAKAFQEEFAKPFWQQIRAVKENRIYDLDINYFGVTANLDTAQAPVLLAEMLYGGLS